MRRLRRVKNAKRLLPEPEPARDEEDQELRMSFFEHLAELRTRLLRALAATIVTTAISVLVTGQVFDYLRTPYCRTVSQPDNCALVVLGPTGSIVAYFRVALMLGGILAMPVIVYQLLMFILPGLTRKERRTVFSALPAITGLFLMGNAFAWFILMPPALGFLEGFQPTLFKPEWTADLYLRFVTSLVFWMGVAFETPLIFFVLALLGVVGPQALIRNWRVAVVGAAVAAAMITPTVDPVNMFLVMAPLLALYILSIFLVAAGRRIARID